MSRRAGVRSRAPARRAAAQLLWCVALLGGCGGGSTVAAPPRDTATTTPPPPAGPTGYVEYLPGELPLVFAAPHGGTELPDNIPPRSTSRCGAEAVTARDLNTAELALAIRDAFLARTGKRPHVIINRLHRERLDANRPVSEAACGNAIAERAWREYHEAIDSAKARVTSSGSSGWFTDLHGHAHAIPRLELGYRLSAAELRRSDAQLDADARLEGESSIATFSRGSPLSFSGVLRGPASLGALLERAGYPAVPGAVYPAPREGEAYFSGGYSTDRHGCSSGGSICGVQVETNYAGVRDTPENRARFATAIVGVYLEYLGQFGVSF